MKQTKRQDFTEGNIPKHLLKFAIPMFLGNLFQALYNTVDTIWVGRFLGPEALGAVSVGFPIIFALVSLVMGIGMGTTVLVSQYAGARQWDEVRRVVINSFSLLSLAGLAVSLIGYSFNEALLRLVNTPEVLIPLASSYISVFFSGLLFMFVFNVMGAILRGLGDSKTPLRFLIVATVTNIILDPLFIFGIGPLPRMEVAGAALATVIAQGISAVLAVRHVYKVNGLLSINIADYKLDRELTLLTLRIGIPAGLQQTVVSLGALVLMSIVNGFGEIVVAGYGVGVRLDQFAFMPSMSVSMAVSAVVGQNLGAGNEDRAHLALRWALILAGGIALVIALGMQFLAWPISSVFTRDPGVLAHSTEYLRIISLSYVFLASLFSLTGFLRGAGDTVPPMLITLVSLWFVRIPLAKYLSLIWGSRGIWIGIAISPVIGLTLSVLYYFKGAWRSKVVTRPPVLKGSRSINAPLER
ncbi:MAG: MATE family efflux transporter [Firmicutes bacterium]|nr:MATE family efflux transporter [Bacillota bacterium]